MKLAGPFDAAMVDLDGTMVNTLGDFVAALGRVLEELGLPPVAPAVVAQLVGKGGAHLVRSVLLASGLASAQADALAADALVRFRHHYNDVNGRFSQVFPGVVAGLEMLRGAGLKLACVTNKPTDASVTLLRAKGLESFFALVAGGDQFERMKPDPMPLLKTCEALGAQPRRALMIGDSQNDALAARAAGCPVVLVTYGFNHGQPIRSVDADGWLDSIATLSFS